MYPSKFDKLDHHSRLQGKLKKVPNAYKTNLKPLKAWYYIRIRYIDGIVTTPEEHRSQKYWESFYLTRNLFFTNLDIKHIELVRIVPYTTTEKTILQHDR